MHRLALMAALLAANSPAQTIDEILHPPVGQVLYVSPQGANQNDGSRQAPFRDIDRALKQARAGDTIAVAGGEYAGMFGIGYLETDKPVKLYGSFSSDFASRSLARTPSVFAPDNASAAKARKPMLAFTRTIDGAVVDGFVFDAGPRNSYSPVKGKPAGVESGMLLLPPQKADGQAPTVLEPLLKVPSAAQGGSMRIRRNLFLNAPNFALQVGLRSGTLTVEDNWFVASRMAAIEVYGTCAGDAARMSEPCGTVEIRRNSILFTWARLDDLQDMGYGIRVMSKLGYRIEGNLIGGNVRGGIDHTRFNRDDWISLDDNQFFANKWGDLYYSPASNTQLNLRVAQFADLPLASVRGNREALPGTLPVDRAYLDGFLTVSYHEEADLDRDSPANQWRALLGVALVGTLRREVSMYANRYPRQAALRLVASEGPVGARPW